jgi:hypothetical protein
MQGECIFDRFVPGVSPYPLYVRNGNILTVPDERHEQKETNRNILHASGKNLTPNLQPPPIFNKVINADVSFVQCLIFCDKETKNGFPLPRQEDFEKQGLENGSSGFDHTLALLHVSERVL